ncbi:unnamed protein product, partial [Nesidiocoris tenuis]
MAAIAVNSQAKNQSDKLYAKMEWLSDLIELNTDGIKNEELFVKSIERTFPYGSFNCFSVLLELPRWSSHRLYCIIWRTDVEELQYMLEFDGYGQFGGREIRFTTSNCSIFSQTGSGRNLSEFSGFDWWIFAEITRRMNVTPRFVEPDFEPSSNCADNRDDGDCGSFVGEVVNGSWVGGTIGTVFDGDADMTFCGNWIESSKINPGIELQYVYTMSSPRIGSSSSCRRLSFVEKLAAIFPINLLRAKFSCILGLTVAQYGPPKQSGPVKHRTTTTTQIPPSANEIFPEGGDSVYQPSPGYQPPAQPQQPGDTGGFHLITGSNPSQQPGGFPSQQPQPGGFPSQQPQPGGFPSQQPKPGSYPSQQPPPPPGSVAVKPVDISDNPFINAGISGKPVTSPPYRPPAPAQPQPAPPSYPSPPQAAPQPQPGGPQPGYPKPPSSGSFQPQPQPGGPQPGYPKPPSSGSLQPQPQQPARPINIQGNPFLSGAIKPSQQPSPGYPAQPSPGYPAQPSPGYPAQPSPGFPAQSSPNPQPPPFRPQPSSPGLPQPPPFRPLPPNQPGQPDVSAYKPGQVSQQPPQLGRPVASGYPNQPSPGYPNQQSPGAPNQPGQGAGPQCYGQGRFCVPAASCSNGVIIGTSAPQSIYKPGQCTPGQVCCSAPQPPSRPQPYSPGFVTDSPVNKYTGPLNTTPPPECAAALKCVPEIYCDEIGVMRDLPVVLTREQQENKVALSDCQNLETGVIGKCCRDPNYKDPWPAGMMMPGGMPAGTPGAFDDGQYKPGSFDDGQYNPGASNAGQYNPPGAPAGGKPTISPPNPYTIKKPLGVFGGNVTPYPVPSAQQPAPLAPKPGQTHQDVFPNNEDKSPSTYPQTAGPQSHPVPSPVNVPGPQRNPTSPYGTSVTPEASEAIRFPTEAAQQPPLALPGTYRPPPGAAGPGSQAPSAPSYGQPSAPSYGQPSAPSYGQPSAPSYGQPSAPGYGQPSAPGYGSPSPQPSSDSQVTPGQQCGVRRPVPPTQADETGFGEFPWHAVVQTAYNGSSLCSAVIIAPNAVLTSAHCIQGFPADKLIVQAGLWKIGEIGQKPVQTLVVTVSAVHPAYNGGSLVKDQAVLLTDTPFQWDQHVDKVCLPASSSQDYVPKTSTCYVTGFGRPALQVEPTKITEIIKPRKTYGLKGLI